MTLQQLAEKYGTDKATHGYCPFYEKHLPPRDAKIKLLEIGVKEGASLKMWGEWFPNAEVHGLDLFSEKSAVQVWGTFMNEHSKQLPDDRFVLHTGNQCDWQVLEELRKYEFDIIIDDGSHNARDQMMTFFGLFNGKQYYIEDLHCNVDPFYSQGLPYNATVDSMFRCLHDSASHLTIDWHNNILLIYAP